MDYVSIEDRTSYNETNVHVDDPHDIGLVLSSRNIDKLNYVGSLVCSDKFRTSIFERLLEGGSNYYLINHKKNRVLSCAFLGSLTARIESKGDFDGYQFYYTILNDGVFHLFYYGKTDFIEDEQAFRQRHAGQLRWYQRAVEALTGIPVKEMWLWSLRLNKGFSVEKE